MFHESAFEAAEGFGESQDSAEFSESAEWSPMRGRPPIPRPNHGNAMARQPQPGYATKAELEATANRLDGRIAVNTRAISALDGRLSSLGAAHNKLEANFRKDAAEKKAAIEGLKQTVENVKMAAMMIPLISSPKSQVIDLGGGKSAKVLIDDGDNFSKLLPVLLLSGGLGGSTSTPGTGSTSDMMMPLMMILALSK